MSFIKITCDSACDLPETLKQRYGITQLPLEVCLGNDRRLDKVNLAESEVYRYSEDTGTLPLISPVSSDTYHRYFKAYSERGCQVLHISLSSRLSRCYQHAAAAAEAFPNVSVVDSESMSAGAGQLALLAAELAGADYQLGELEAALNDMKQHLKVSCLLQSSAFLHRNGRQGGLCAFADRLLKWKPEISLNGGKICPGAHYKGDLEQSVLSYVRQHLEGRTNLQTDRILISASNVPGAVMDKAKDLIWQLQHFDQILEVPASSAVSCRCGPGNLGLSYMTI